MERADGSAPVVAFQNVTSVPFTRQHEETDPINLNGVGLILACVYLIVALTCIGCNLLVSSMICLEKGLRKRPQPLLLLNTAVFDLVKGALILIFTVPTCLWRGWMYPEAAYLVYTCLNLMWRHESSVTMAFISSCRYVVVCRKHCKSLRKDCRRQVVAAMLTTSFLALVGSVCLTWTRTHVPGVVTIWGSPVRIENASEIIGKDFIVKSHSPKGTGLNVADFVFLLPLTVSLVCFMKVAREFHVHPNGRAPMNGVNQQRIKREMGVSKMCGVMVGLKFLSETLSVTLSILEQLKGPSLSLIVLSSVVRDCTCALNPLIYFIGSPRCRSNVRKMFAKLCVSCRSNRVSQDASRISMFQLERRLSLIQGAQGGRAQQRPPVSVPNIFQVNRRVTTYDGQPILVIEVDHASNQPSAPLREEIEVRGDDADDIRDDGSNLAPDSLIGNVSVSSSCFTAGHGNHNKDGGGGFHLEVLMSKTPASRSSDWVAQHMRTASHGHCSPNKEHMDSLPGVDTADPEDLEDVLKRLPWYSHNLKSTPDLRSEDSKDIE